MSENNSFNDKMNTKLNQKILKQKSLSYKKKLLNSKYKNINKKTKENETNDIQKDKTNFELESLRNLDPIQVSCNNTIGQLFKKKFGSGGKGKCIQVVQKLGNSENEEKWLTPIEFENYSGKGSCRDWKRTIKVGGISLMSLLKDDILTCHAASCSCGACNENEQVVGPIRTMVKMRRRNKDEIYAQNAFKKFLSLKPPTILAQKLQNLTESSKLKTKNISFLSRLSNRSDVETENQNSNSIEMIPNLKKIKLPETESSKLQSKISFLSRSSRTDSDSCLNDTLQTFKNLKSNIIDSNTIEQFECSILELEKNETKQWNLLELVIIKVYKNLFKFKLKLQLKKGNVKFNKSGSKFTSINTKSKKRKRVKSSKYNQAIF